MRRGAVEAAFVLSLAALTGCSGATDPLSQIAVGLAIPGAHVLAGDSIQFRATAFNPSPERVQIGHACGPALDVLVMTPAGDRRSVLQDLLGSTGAFTCELGPQHFAEPGETELVRLPWRVPAERGEYEARAVLHDADGRPTHLSAPVGITVR